MQLPWRIRARISVYMLAILFGAIAGIFVLYPTNEFVYFYEHHPIEETRPIDYAGHQLQRSLKGQTPKKTAFYAIVGVVLSVGAAAMFSALLRRSQEIEQLSSQLENDLPTLIARGESSTLEFKSSFRWDLRENRQSRALEGVILKTLAGYMNSNGGTLLIGVADDGSIVGIENDYRTLKKPDRDGFEQTLMTSVASKLGGDACRSVQMVFHSLQEKDICRVIVSAAHRPVYLRDGEQPRLYVRTGVSTRELNVQDAINYTASRWPR